MIKLLRSAVLLAVCYAVPVTAGPSRSAASSQDAFVGKYHLTDDSLHSELELSADCTFYWSLQEAFLDGYGDWSKDGTQLVLHGKRPPEAPQFLAMPDDEYNIKIPAADSEWVAMVGIPGQTGLADVEVRFVGQKGEVGTAVTNAAGDASVAVRPGADRWARAGLRRANTQDAWQWFDIAPQHADQRLTGFMVYDRGAVQPPFKELRVDIADGQSGYLLKLTEPAYGTVLKYTK